MGVSQQTETATETEPASRFDNELAWRAGAVAGLVATVVMGVAITLVDLSTLRTAVAGLYGFQGSLVAGWVAHLVHGTLFGLGFAAILSDPGLYRLTNWTWKTVLAGVVYGLVLAIVGAGFFMPIWLSAVGLAVETGFPAVTTPMVAWHVLYGLVLGLVYAAIDGR